MHQSHPNSQSRCFPEGTGLPLRGLTLIELTIAMAITSMMSVVLGSLMLAVQAAREHTEGLEDATMQAQVAVERMKYMVSQAGVYQAGGNPTTLGLAVVSHRWSYFPLPDVLVVWSGGQAGGMVSAGVQARLPQISELVIYAPAPKSPKDFVEITLPKSTGTIDFRDSNFSTQILDLINSNAAQQTLICDRIRTSQLAGWWRFGGQEVGNVRFELEWTPGDSALAMATPGTAAWYDLSWSQGIVSSDSGLRQATVRMEFQIRQREPDTVGAASLTPAIPYFGSTNFRYVHQP